MSLFGFTGNGKVKSGPRQRDWHLTALDQRESRVAAEEVFEQKLALERKRAERSKRSLLLVYLDGSPPAGGENPGRMMRKVHATMSVSIRETDLSGWSTTPAKLGILFTEIDRAVASAAVTAILSRVKSILEGILDARELNEIRISHFIFPEESSHDSAGPAIGREMYPELLHRGNRKPIARVFKSIIDIVGSILALIVMSPLFLLFAVLIKLSSKGPVFFKQQRVGQMGKPFTFIKFRSMYESNDPAIHREYINRFIAGHAEEMPDNQNGGAVYKLTDDPRVTPIGRFLRRTSLDELPQLFNVLCGEMSLVGPRPPIPYEVERYAAWHKGRVLEAKPGMTGLWQVSGRSKTTFDEMVRMDIRYARSWSIWLDLKILLKTAQVVYSGEGGY